MRERAEAAQEHLEMLKSAWNAHMDRCETPTVEGISNEEFFKRLSEWRDAPSNTASYPARPS
jgi:hypothetical protein